MNEKTVNLEKIKESLEKLDELAEKYPRLVNKNHPASVDEWLETLKEEENAKK